MDEIITNETTAKTEQEREELIEKMRAIIKYKWATGNLNVQGVDLKIDQSTGFAAL